MRPPALEEASLQMLIDLVKVGAIGASLAFLYLSQQLLKAELSLKDGAGRPISPRPEALSAIKQSRSAALVFLVVGVMSELLLSHTVDITHALTQRLFSKEFAGARFQRWVFDPDAPSIAFEVERNQIQLARSVSPPMMLKTDLYVAVREKGENASNVGTYPLLYGPYQFGNIGLVEVSLKPEEAMKLGSRCAQFSVFGVLRTDDRPTSLRAPFEPGALATPPIVFDAASACVSSHE